MVEHITLTDVASILTVMITAWVAWRAWRIERQGLVTHDLVNSLSNQRLEAGKAESFAKGEIEGRLSHLEKNNNKERPPQ